MPKQVNPFLKYLTEEQKDHASLCKYLEYQYPQLLWWHTPNEGKKTAFERFLFAIMGGKKGVSDFIIIEPKGGYNGLVIELKAVGTKLFKRDGSCYYPEQNEFLYNMRNKGFFATFAVGYDEAKAIIDDYMKL